jgi:hypothetical protein
MENSFQTSFIPKKLITPENQSKEPKSLFSLIAVFLLIVTVIASISLYVYKIYLTKQEEKLSSSLTTNLDSFEKDTISELELFNKRTKAAEEVLGDHVILSPVFTLLGEITIPSIQYTKFEHETNDKGFVVNMEGVALDYRSIALQADMFNTVKGRSFENVLFSNLTKDKNNNITFNLQFTVNPDLLSYEKSSLLESSDTTTSLPLEGSGTQAQ